MQILPGLWSQTDIIYAGLMVEGVSPQVVSPLMHRHGLLKRASSLAANIFLKKPNPFLFRLVDSRETQNLTFSSSFGAQALSVVIRGDHHSYFSYVHPDTGEKLFKHFYIIPMTGLIYKFSKNGNVIQKSYPVLAKSVQLQENPQFNPEHLFVAYQNGLRQLAQDIIDFPPYHRTTKLHAAGRNRFHISLGKNDGVLEGTIVSHDSGAELKVEEVQEKLAFLTLRQGKISAGSEIVLRVDNVELPTVVFSIYPMTNQTLRKIFDSLEQKQQITQWATEIFNRHTNYRVLPPELKEGFSLVSLEPVSIDSPISAAGMSHEVIQSAYGGAVNQIRFAPVEVDREFFVKLSGLDSLDMTAKLPGLKRTGSRMVMMKVWSAIRHQGQDYEGTASAQIKILKDQLVDPRPILTDLVYEAVENAVKTYKKEN